MKLMILLSMRWSINLALSAILGYSFVQLFLINAVPLKTHSKQTAVHQTDIVTRRLNISSLLKSNLFGKYQITTQTLARATQIPETKLNLKLHGIYHSSIPKKSFAMIATTKSHSVSYHMNQSLPSGAQLYDIQKRKVILLRNGRYETLHLVDKKDTYTRKKVTTNKKSDHTPGKLLAQYQRQLQTNPESLMTLVRVFPVRRGKQLVGYRIKSGKDASLLSRFNLQSGDILTTVNGVKLNSPIKGLTIVQQLATATHVDLQVLRRGQVIPLSFTIEK
ncbi:MAG: type II secretion system protein GspC [Thiomargarita sp.]|nr:type II secretion system protein GspC [Thiomargarita sp.]